MKVQFKQWECIAVKRAYPNGNIAIVLENADKSDPDPSPIATATVNLVKIPLEERHVHVKEWSENDGMTEALIKAGVIEPKFTIVPVGPHGSFASVCKMTDEFINSEK